MFSDEFERIWSRPMLVDQLLQIWDIRKTDQRDRDIWQYKSLMMLDRVATMTHNVNVKEEDRTRSLLRDMFEDEEHGSPKVDPIQAWKDQQRAISEAYKKNKGI